MTEDFSHSGNFKGCRKSVPKVGTKTKCVFLIINHSITPLPNLWLRTMMICCFSQPCGLGVWAGLVWLALLLCVTSVGVTHSSVFSWGLGWVRQDNRVSTHWSRTLIVFSVASLWVMSYHLGPLYMASLSRAMSWISLQPDDWFPRVKVDVARPGIGISSLLPHSMVNASHTVSPGSGICSYFLMGRAAWKQEQGRRNWWRLSVERICHRQADQGVENPSSGSAGRPLAHASVLWIRKGSHGGSACRLCVSFCPVCWCHTSCWMKG